MAGLSENKETVCVMISLVLTVLSHSLCPFCDLLTGKYLILEEQLLLGGFLLGYGGSVV